VLTTIIVEPASDYRELASRNRGAGLLDRRTAAYITRMVLTVVA
jgi:hypothetical protein